jgi:hypothetical protein
VPLRVQLGAALQLPGQQHPADAPAAPVGVHPPLQVHTEGVPEGGRGDGAGVADQLAVRGQHDPGVPVQVDEVVHEPAGEVLGVLVHAGVVDGLAHREQRGERDDVVGAHRAGGQPLGQGERSAGHGTRD